MAHVQASPGDQNFLINNKQVETLFISEIINSDFSCDALELINNGSCL